jgi:hypothetical protein
MDNIMLDPSHSLDTLSAQGLLDQPTVFHDPNLLKIRLEFTLGGFHRVAAALTKSRCLATLITTSHFVAFLSKFMTFWCGGNVTTSPAVHQLHYTIGDFQL